MQEEPATMAVYHNWVVVVSVWLFYQPQRIGIVPQTVARKTVGDSFVLQFHHFVQNEPIAEKCNVVAVFVGETQRGSENGHSNTLAQVVSELSVRNGSRIVLENHN